MAGILSSILGALGNNTVGQSALPINGPMTDTSQGGGLLGGDPSMSAQGGGAMGAGNSSGGLFGAGGLLDFNDPKTLIAMQLIANGSKAPGQMFDGIPQIAAYGQRMQQDRQERAAADRDRRDKLEQTNKTEEWIRANRPDFATYLDAGVSPADVFKMATAPVKQTTTQERIAALAEAGLDPQSREGQHYLLTGDLPDLGKTQFQVVNGVPTWVNTTEQTIEPIQGFEKPMTRQLTREEIIQRGLDPSKAYEVAPDGKTSEIGGSLVTIDNTEPADGNLRKELDKNTAQLWSEYQKSGSISAANREDFGVLGELIKVAPQGPLTGRLAQAFPGFSTAGAAFQSIVTRVAPSLRVPGSGAQSDIEYEGMLRSLPSLLNTPEANVFINEMMTAKANINVERAKVIADYRTNDISAAEAERKLSEIDSRSIMSPQLRQALAGVSGSNGQTSNGVQWSYEDE